MRWHIKQSEKKRKEKKRSKRNKRRLLLFEEEPSFGGAFIIGEMIEMRGLDMFVVSALTLEVDRRS